MPFPAGCLCKPQFATLETRRNLSESYVAVTCGTVTREKTWEAYNVPILSSEKYGKEPRNFVIANIVAIVYKGRIKIEVLRCIALLVYWEQQHLVWFLIKCYQITFTIAR